MMEQPLSYTPKPEDKLNEVFSELIDYTGYALGQITNPNYKQVYPEASDKMRYAYCKMQILSSVLGKPLDTDDKKAIQQIMEYIKRLKDEGYYKIGMKIAPV